MISGCIFSLSVDDLLFPFPDYFDKQWIKMNYKNWKSFGLAFASSCHRPVFVTYGDINPALISHVYGLLHGVSYTGRLCFADCVFRAKCSPRFRIENITSSHWLQRIFADIPPLERSPHISYGVISRRVVCDVHPFWWTCWQLHPKLGRK